MRQQRKKEGQTKGTAPKNRRGKTRGGGESKAGEEGAPRAEKRGTGRGKKVKRLKK